MHAHAVDLDRLGVEFDDEIPGLDDGLGMALGTPSDTPTGRRSENAWNKLRRND
jgi:hypothetical protein